MLSRLKRVVKLTFLSKRVVFLLLFFFGEVTTAAKALIATDDSVGVVHLLQQAGEDGVRKKTSLFSLEASLST